ncbi:MAG: hypothetical protein GY774_20655 [Planctomycetes bacterium]|nr:hypothetical protein [Planctomycetota bacterium]
MSFRDEFRREREAHIGAAQEVVRLAAIEMVNFVITYSPVGNSDLWKTKYKPSPENYTPGRFRSNWFLTKSRTSARQSDEIRNPGAIIQSYSRRILRENSEKWILTNNMPYAKRLDNGWSTQAPNGITEPAALHVNSKIRQLEDIANRRFGIR